MKIESPDPLAIANLQRATPMPQVINGERASFYLKCMAVLSDQDVEKPLKGKPTGKKPSGQKLVSPYAAKRAKFFKPGETIHKALVPNVPNSSPKVPNPQAPKPELPVTGQDFRRAPVRSTLRYGLLVCVTIAFALLRLVPGLVPFPRKAQKLERQVKEFLSGPIGMVFVCTASEAIWHVFSLS